MGAPEPQVDENTRQRGLGMDEEGWFRTVRDLELPGGTEVLPIGSSVRLLDVVLVGRTHFARVSRIWHGGESWLVALDKLF